MHFLLLCSILRICVCQWHGLARSWSIVTHFVYARCHRTGLSCSDQGGRDCMGFRAVVAVQECYSITHCHFMHRQLWGLNVC